MKDRTSELLALPAGMSVAQQAKTLGMSNSGIYRLRRAAGISAPSDPSLPGKRREIEARFLALPIGLSTTEQAAALGISLWRVLNLRKVTGQKGIGDRIRADEDREIMARFIALPPCSHREAARLLGVTYERLAGARARTGGASVEMPTDTAAEAPFFPQRSAEALPAGDPRTWGVISSDPWPGYAR
jgi:hypothetical protein